MQRSVRVRHRRIRRVAAHKPRGKLLPLIIVMLAAMALLGAGGGVAALTVYQGFAHDLPADPTGAFAQANLGPAKIYDRNGTLLYQFEDEIEGLRAPLPLADISPWVTKATIATEDSTFYTNPGINLKGLARAAVENFVSSDSGVLQGSGGSSITQQLVKNVFIPEAERYERSPERKLKEAVLARELTERYSKDQILEWYLNQIPYGNRANGIGAAAKRYFGKNAKDLTLAQASLLAGLPQSPSLYDPYRNRDAALTRQHEVLDLMVRHGELTEAEASAARAEDLIFAEPSVTLLAPHWVFYVRDLLVQRYGAEKFRQGGLNVITTLDLPLQNKAEQIIEERISFYESAKGGSCECHNASLVAMDNNTGEIRAMVGSRNYWNRDIEGENNNAIAIKQPGSALKPLVYTAAFEKGWNPGTIIYDQPTKFISKIDGPRREYFTPEGPPARYLGPLSARESLASSMNTAAVKAAGYVGPDSVIDMAHRLGITSLDDRENYGVSIATGGSNITLLDLTYAYTVIANNGEMRGVPATKPVQGHRKLDPVAILKVTDGNGATVYEFKGPDRDQVVEAGYAYQVTDILKDHNAKRHTYTNPEAQFNLVDKRPLAAKTGTQQGPKDIRSVLSTWNFGYVPDFTVGVWVGNANNALVNANLTSASSSLLIWKDFMQSAVDMLKIAPKEFTVPSDIEWKIVNGKREPIVKGTKVLDREDLKLWAAAGNAVTQQVGGADPSTGFSSDPNNTAPPSSSTVVPGAAPSRGTGAAPVVPGRVVTPVPTAAPATRTVPQPAAPVRVSTAAPAAQPAPSDDDGDPAPAPAPARPAATAAPVTAQPAPVATAAPVAPVQPAPQPAPQATPQPQPQAAPPAAPPRPVATVCVPGPPLYPLCP